MHFNPEKHYRRSIRLRGYDYSQAGLYFVTICVTDMACLFGSVRNGKMVLNEAGNMVEKWYLKLPSKYPDIELGDYTVMPNHFHAIIINNGKGNPDTTVRANPCVRPAESKADSKRAVPNGKMLGEHTVPNGEILGEHTVPNGEILGEHMGSPLRDVVSWFKTMSTNEYFRGVKNHDWPRFRGKLWQRNYYEHIIRNQRSFENISGYIANNSAHWEADKFYRNQ